MDDRGITFALLNQQILSIVMKSSFLVFLAIITLAISDPLFCFQEQEEVVACEDMDPIEESNSRNSLITLSAPWRSPSPKYRRFKQVADHEHLTLRRETFSPGIPKEITILSDS